MFSVFKLTISYMRYYKKQTLVTLIGIILSAILLSGIGSLTYSGEMADLESARNKYGDWHYEVIDENNLLSTNLDNKSNEKNDENYTIDKQGVLVVKKVVDEPYHITFCSADEDYMKMMNRTLLEGSYPSKKGEVALDYYTINNLGLSDEIGSTIEICDNQYILTGVLTDGCIGDDKQSINVFVSDEESLDTQINHIYLKFDETNRVYNQFENYIKNYDIDHENINQNNKVTSYVGGEAETSIWQIAKVSFTHSDAGIVYFISNLNESIGLKDKVVFIALAIFGAFVIFSLFEISVVKRFEQYALLQTLGLENTHIFATLFLELLSICIIGYPIGCFAGNSIAKLVYSRIGGIFSTGNMGAKFYVSKSMMYSGAIFFFILILLICLIMVHRMSKRSEIEMMRNIFTNKKQSNKIFSKKSHNLTNVMTRRFMFGKISTFVGIIVSLSLGGVIFLSTTYMADSSIKNNNHTTITDDGAGSNIGVYIDSDNGGFNIPQNIVDKIKSNDNISKANELSYLLGEINLDNGVLKWTDFFNSHSEKLTIQDKRVLDKYNGELIQQSEDSYKLKVNVYGYTNNMLNSLDDYIIDGEINTKTIKQKNSVILKTITDGQGNTDGIDLHAGDKIKLKVPKSMENTESLKFTNRDDEYIEKEFTISAIVKRPIAKYDKFIGDNGSSNVDIIMSNEQMNENFGVCGYKNISVNIKDGVKSQNVVKELRKATSGISHVMINDYTEIINQKNMEIKHKVYFFYGIAAILLCISLLHIINSMRFIIMSHIREFGIVRAMGITDNGFMKMLIHEGISYGIYTSILMMIIYLIVHQIMYYIMIHVNLYIIAESNIMPLQCLFMIIINIIICVLSVVAAGRKILKEDIINELRC